jgi:hypothetical protein
LAVSVVPRGFWTPEDGAGGVWTPEGGASNTWVLES